MEVAGEEAHHIRIAIDGGADSHVGGRLDAWLVTDERAELIAAIRRRARPFGLTPRVARFLSGSLAVIPRRVVHTSHLTYAYDIRWRGRRVVWAPEFWRLPRWAVDADLLFADASGWSRPIRFRGGAGGHAAAVTVAERARAMRVRELVFAHIGRPTIMAIDAGLRAPFGRPGRDGESFHLRPRASAR